MIHNSGFKQTQPLLVNHQVILSAPYQAWSDDSGEMGQAAIHGFYASDTRIIKSLNFRLGGRLPEALSVDRRSAFERVYVGLDRQLDQSSTADPRLRIDRRQRVGKLTRGNGFSEEFTITNAADLEIETVAELEILCDFADIVAIKSAQDPVVADYQFDHHESQILCQSGDLSVNFEAEEACIRSEKTEKGLKISLSWPIRLSGKSSVKFRWRVTVQDRQPLYLLAEEKLHLQLPDLTGVDFRLKRWIERSLEDLEALLMQVRISEGQSEVFIGAGAPWYLTLYGRDCLWAAQMLLPIATNIAASTLRALAALQGKVVNPANAEQPGKILHEIRKVGAFIEKGQDQKQFELPAIYYGTIDATLLWVIVLRDAWKSGLADSEVKAMLPNLEAALVWLKDYADADGDGFIEYRDESGKGLSNQGWKDSGDGINFHEGRLAEAPIALSEVQGYAYAAALAGAELLEHYGQSGADFWRDWAAELKKRFSAKFWIGDLETGYPALALDKNKQQVDALASNMGHLLTTGILSKEQTKRVAKLLVSPELNSGYGLRTLATTEARYWPLTYHNGSVWPHDTAIAIRGLINSGFIEEAHQLIKGMLKAAEAFDYRIPELYSGDGADQWSKPIEYSAACRPLCWSAGAAFVVLDNMKNSKKIT